MIEFNPQKPFGEILGQPGLAFLQDGHTFNARGQLVTSEMAAALKPVLEESKEPSPRDDSMLKIYETKSDDSEPSPETSNIENMHWKKLQKMVQAYGGEYKTREQAVAFLKNGTQ